MLVDCNYGSMFAFDENWENKKFYEIHNISKFVKMPAPIGIGTFWEKKSS